MLRAKCRLQLQDELRHLTQNPQDQDVKNVEKLQESIQGRFLLLHKLQQAVSGISDIIDFEQVENPYLFDDIDDDILPNDVPRAAGLTPDVLVPDKSADSVRPAHPPADDSTDSRVPGMPSTCRISEPHHRAVELALRRLQAIKHLHKLREAIADKSFQHSHIIRVAPQKSVKTRARSTITTLQRKISFHCRAYNKCRSAMVRLAANDETLSRFRVLIRDDVKSSTALLNPNIPGSTKIHLSWIWHTEPSTAADTPQALQECMSICWAYTMSISPV